MAVALMDKAAGQAKLPETPAVVALFAFGSRLDRDTMQLFARTHSEEVRAAAIASTGQERTQGRRASAMALYGQVVTQRPHLMQRS